jgi:hypothetical protein
MELHHLAALTQAHNMKHLFRCVAKWWRVSIGLSLRTRYDMAR